MGAVSISFLKVKERVLGVLLSTFSLMCYALEVKDF